MKKNNATVGTYTYDSNGMRTGKVAGGLTTTYHNLNGVCYGETRSDGKNLQYVYDENGRVIGFRVQTSAGSNRYYFVFNAQGDVVQLMHYNGTVVANYSYDTWGNCTATSASGGALSPSSIGAINPFRYRGYYYDNETGLYYLQSRYYDPVVGRFLNADGYVSTGQDINGNNMFAYCGNNPVNRIDSSGMFWKEIGDFFKEVGTAIADFAKAIFGAGATTVQQTKQETELCPPIIDQLVTVKTGKKISTTISSSGNSTKPISVYAQGRSDSPLLSSAGLKINISSFTLNVSLGLDNIGISGSVKNGNTTNSFGLSADLSQLKIGFEGSTTIKWDENTNSTTYTNVGITGWGIVAMCTLVTTGQWYPSPQPAYS